MIIISQSIELTNMCEVNAVTEKQEHFFVLDFCNQFVFQEVEFPRTKQSRALEF